VDTRLLLAWLHLLALAVGVGGVWSRARALRHSLRDPADVGALRRAYVGDLWWGVALGVWLVTGLWRLFGGTEKNFTWYFGNHDFLLKMALVLAIAALEVWPRRTLWRWHTSKAAPDPRDAGRIEAVSYVQCALLLVIVLSAAGMARGYGTPTAVGASAPVAQSGTAAAPTSADPSAGPTNNATTGPPIAPTGTETVTADDLALLTGEIAMPLDGVDPTTLHSNFAERRGGGTRQHQALDIMASRRTPVKSAAKGRVLKLFTSVDGGLMVYAADSSERFVLMYAHLDGYAPAMRDGAPLARGEVIGYVGSTGNALASAPHLHFAIARSADVKRWSKGRPIDPLPVLVAARR
jgi:murein DD-endopeptidase MepM/ murein hydrolase activator NlpD